MKKIELKYDNTPGSAGELPAGDWNPVIQEIITFVESMGIVLDETKTTQLLDAIEILARQNIYTVLSQTGTQIVLNSKIENRLTLPLSDGMTFIFKNTLDNTGAINIQLHGNLTKTLIDGDGNDLTAGMLKANKYVTFAYNKTLDKYELLTVATGDATIDLSKDAHPVIRLDRDSVDPKIFDGIVYDPNTKKLNVFINQAKDGSDGKSVLFEISEDGLKYRGKDIATTDHLHDDKYLKLTGGTVANNNGSIRFNGSHINILDPNGKNNVWLSVDELYEIVSLTNHGYGIRIDGKKTYLDKDVNGARTHKEIVTIEMLDEFAKVNGDITKVFNMSSPTDDTNGVNLAYLKNYMGLFEHYKTYYNGVESTDHNVVLPKGEFLLFLKPKRDNVTFPNDTGGDLIVGGETTSEDIQILGSPAETSNLENTDVPKRFEATQYIFNKTDGETLNVKLNVSPTGAKFGGVFEFILVKLTGNTVRPGTVIDNTTNADTTAPTITLLGDNPMVINIGETYTDPGYTAADNSGQTPNVEVTGTVDNNTKGSYTVTYKATDAAGNTTTVTRTIEVIDNVNPIITIIGNNPITVEAGTTFTDPGATATDNSDGNITANITSTSDVDTNVKGTYTITYTVTDSTGNTGTASRTVNVVDTVAPVVTINGDNPLILEAGTEYTELSASANDTIDGNLSVSTIGTVDNMKVGENVITYSATDTSGNKSTVTRLVKVVDTTPPVITLQGNTNIYLKQSDVYIDPGALANDIVDGDVTGFIKVTHNIDTETPGNYIVRYNVSDSSGNASDEVTRTVTVMKKPTVIRVEIEDMNIVDGFVIEDKAYASGGKIVQSTSTSSNNATTNFTGETGTYVMVVKGLDETDGTGTLKMYVGGNEVINETLNLLDGSGQNEWMHYAWQGNINNGDEIKISTTKEDGEKGRYDFIDFIKIEPSTPDIYEPMIYLNGDSVYNLPIDGNYIDAGVVAIDAVDGLITNNVNTVSNVDYTNNGNYEVTFTISDAANNQKQLKRFVNITDDPDVTPPVISLQGDNPMVMPLGGTYIDPGFIATDDRDGVITDRVGATPHIDVNTEGTYHVYYNVTDSSNNSADTVIRTVNVVEDKAPIYNMTEDLLTIDGFNYLVDANGMHNAKLVNTDGTAFLPTTDEYPKDGTLILENGRMGLTGFLQRPNVSWRISGVYDVIKDVSFKSYVMVYDHINGKLKVYLGDQDNEPTLTKDIDYTPDGSEFIIRETPPAIVTS